MSEMPVAVIHYGPLVEGEDPSARLSRGIGPALRRALTDRGIDTYSTRGVRSFTKEGVVSWKESGDLLSEITLDSDRIGVVRDISGGFTLETPCSLPEASVINHPEVRQFDNKVFAARQEIFSGYQIPTSEFLSGDDIDLALDRHTGHVIFKPTSGFASKGLLRTDKMTRQQVQDILDGHETEVSYAMQPIVDNKGIMPGIRPRTEQDTALFEVHASDQKELRIFWFHGSQGMSWLPIARLTDQQSVEGEAYKSTDHYAAIDEDTVPGEIIDATMAAAKKVAELSGESELSGAFDFCYGSIGKEAPRWYIMEGNFWQVVPPSRKRFSELNGQFVGFTADQIARSAWSKK